MIRRQVIVPAPPERVWEFLTDPGAAGPWLGGHLDWSPAAGGRISFEGDDGCIRHGVVQEVRPNRYIRYTWWPAGSGDGPPSEVAFLLEPAAGDTRLTVMEIVLEHQDPPSPGHGARRTAEPPPPGPSSPPDPPQASALADPCRQLPASAALRAAAPTDPSRRWSVGDELMLSSWSRTASLCQLG